MLLMLSVTFFNILIVSELHNLNMKLGNEQYNKIDLLHPLVGPQLSGGWQHKCSTKTRQVSLAHEQSIYFN
jgi:hypothetical protein